MINFMGRLTVMSTYLLAETGVGSVIFWSVVLIGLLLAGFWVVITLRNWLKSEDIPSGGIGFTLSDLRQLHREGKMTTEEFERAREKFIAAGKAMAAKLPDPLARDRKQTPPER